MGSGGVDSGVSTSLTCCFLSLKCVARGASQAPHGEVPRRCLGKKKCRSGTVLRDRRVPVVGPEACCQGRWHIWAWGRGFVVFRAVMLSYSLQTGVLLSTSNQKNLAMNLVIICRDSSSTGRVESLSGTLLRPFFWVSLT